MHRDGRVLPSPHHGRHFFALGVAANLVADDLPRLAPGSYRVLSAVHADTEADEGSRPVS